MDDTTRQIIDDFALLATWEERYAYVIELGRELPAMDPALKSESSKVRGCVSQVWLVARPDLQDPARVEFLADSDAHIVRGVVAILLRLYSRKTPQEIARTDAMQALRAIGLEEQLSPSRRNGLRAMVDKIHQLAAAFATHPPTSGDLS